MKSEQFDEVVGKQLELCTDVLNGKAKEYAADQDRLHNFKLAAEMQGCSAKRALSGMMAKHTISVYDMCDGDNDGDSYPIELWSEKITDSINYLLLLRALVEEEISRVDHEELGEIYASPEIHYALEEIEEPYDAPILAPNTIVFAGVEYYVDVDAGGRVWRNSLTNQMYRTHPSILYRTRTIILAILDHVAEQLNVRVKHAPWSEEVIYIANNEEDAREFETIARVFQDIGWKYSHYKVQVVLDTSVMKPFTPVHTIDTIIRNKIIAAYASIAHQEDRKTIMDEMFTDSEFLRFRTNDSIRLLRAKQLTKALGSYSNLGCSDELINIKRPIMDIRSRMKEN